MTLSGVHRACSTAILPIPSTNKTTGISEDPRPAEPARGVSMRHFGTTHLRFGLSSAVVFLAWLLSAPEVEAQQVEDAAVSILQQKCLQCHGETLQMSGLDVRTREALLKGGDKGPAIVPGNAEASRAYRRVAGMEQPLMPMAPLPPLSSDELAILKSWINQGAKWK